MTPTKCGAWPNLGGCTDIEGHNTGNADVPENHTFPTWREASGALGPAKLQKRVEGVGPDTPTITAANGAKQSDVPYHAHTGPIRAILAMARVQKGGDEKYGVRNWRGIPIQEHVNHALIHLYAHLAGDTQDEHLLHALCRLGYAVEGEILGDPQPESETNRKAALGE